MTVDHRRTAAAWHGEAAGSSLEDYARTGTVSKALIREIKACLDIVEHNELDLGFDPVEEHQRLTALLHHVEPEWAKLRAKAAGRWYGSSRGVGAAERWTAPLAGGQDDPEAEAAVRQLLRGIDDGDPAVLDLGTSWDNPATAEILAEWGWKEPGRDDPAHRRWAAAHGDVVEAYATAYAEAFWDMVAEICRAELESRPEVLAPSEEHRGTQPGADMSTNSPAAHRSLEGPASSTEGSGQSAFVRTVRNAPAGASPDPVPPGWVSEQIGLWGHEDAEVVFDPRRHNILLTWSPPTDDVAAGLESSGWEQRGEASGRTFWVRDPVAATRAALERVDREAERDRTLTADRLSANPARLPATEVDRGMGL